MLKKTITYTDYSGKERTEDFYFHISEAELAERELVHHKVGYGNYIQRIIDDQDGRQIIDVFKEIIKDSYGIRTDDDKSFIKTEEAFKKFEGSPAYSNLFVELVTDADQASAFIRGIMPGDLGARAAEAQAVKGFRPGADTRRPTPPVAGAPSQDILDQAKTSGLHRGDSFSFDESVRPTQAPEYRPPVDTPPNPITHDWDDVSMSWTPKQ